MPPKPRQHPPSYDRVVMLILLLALGGLFLLNKADVYMSFESDGYFHALGGLFVHDLADWWLKNPTLSFGEVRDFVIHYETQYKFFGGIGYYQPFHNVFTGLMLFLAGRQPLAFYITTALETLGAIYFAARIYRLLYGENRMFLFILVLLIGLSPGVFNYGASYSLEPGVMLFATASLYFFIRFLRLEERRDLFLTAAALGMGIITKSSFVIVIPMLFLAAVLERKAGLFLRNPRALLISFLIFLAVLSPWIGSEMVYSQLGISKLGERINAATLHFDIPSVIRLMSLDITLLYMFGSLLAIPFFLYWLLRSGRSKGEVTLITFIFLYTLFYFALPNIQARYFTAVVPALMVLVTRGVQTFWQREQGSRVAVLLISLLVLSQGLAALSFTSSFKQFTATTDVFSPAIFISDNTDNRTTVLSTFSRMQSVPFVFLEDPNVNIVRAPFEREGGKEELRLMLDSIGYVKRPHKPEWERFGMVHPPIEWVVVHERLDTLEPDYSLKELIDQRADFELVRTFQGKAPGNRVFVYKRKSTILLLLNA